MTYGAPWPPTDLVYWRTTKAGCFYLPGVRLAFLCSFLQAVYFIFLHIFYISSYYLIFLNLLVIISLFHFSFSFCLYVSSLLFLSCLCLFSLLNLHHSLFLLPSSASADASAPRQPCRWFVGVRNWCPPAYPLPAARGGRGETCAAGSPPVRSLSPPHLWPWKAFSAFACVLSLPPAKEPLQRPPAVPGVAGAYSCSLRFSSAWRFF